MCIGPLAWYSSSSSLLDQISRASVSCSFASAARRACSARGKMDPSRRPFMILPTFMISSLEGVKRRFGTSISPRGKACVSAV